MDATFLITSILKYIEKDSCGVRFSSDHCFFPTLSFAPSPWFFPQLPSASISISSCPFLLSYLLSSLIHPYPPPPPPPPSTSLSSLPPAHPLSVLFLSCLSFTFPFLHPSLPCFFPFLLPYMMSCSPLKKLISSLFPTVIFFLLLSFP